jgi:3'-phosphoadenosine 5'-phosphosulfate sulfotransferase (PAPS reductase)/FAD synthetase
MTVNNLSTIEALRDRGAFFVINHSGGKDSQTQTIKVLELVPHDQILVIHAVLPEVDWLGCMEHIKDTVPADIPVIHSYAKKTFFEMVDHRQHWPSPSYRQCTSDLKRGPLERDIRRFLKKNPQYGGLVVNCMGLRAEESPNRAKATPFKHNPRNSKAGREWYDWLPIHELLVGDLDTPDNETVFGTIAAAGQKPHWVYYKGMSRLSCVFCIMANKSDLQTAARLEPELYARYVATEQHIGKSFLMPSKKHGVQFLPQVTGIDADPISLAHAKARLSPSPQVAPVTELTDDERANLRSCF